MTENSTDIDPVTDLVPFEIPDEIKQLVQETFDAVSKYDNFVQVTNNFELEQASAALKEIVVLKKKVDAKKNEMLHQISIVHDTAVNFWKPIILYLEKSEQRVKKLSISFTNEQKRIKAEAERKARLEAAEKERKERERLAAIAEEERKRRLEAEEKRREAERKEKEARKAKEEAERKIRELEQQKEIEAVEAEKKRQEQLRKDEEYEQAKVIRLNQEIEDSRNREETLKDKQEKVYEAPDFTNVPKVHKAAGLVHAETWDIEIKDASAVPREYCKPDEKYIRHVVKEAKGQIEIPGVRIFKKQSARVMFD